MQIDLAEIARGRRIVATMAREMLRTRRTERPKRMSATFKRFLRRLRA